VDNPPIVQHKTKTDYFDTRLTGFFLEVRATGKATYYQRYQDQNGWLWWMGIASKKVFAIIF
jgi:hypothetical protein